jgi:DNA-binding protein HU-beta
MTKADIIDRIANGTGLTKIDTEAVVDGFFKTIIDSLAAGNGIEIRGFGSFRVKKKNPRNARNPRTGEKVFVGEHFVPAFKFSKDFKAAVDLGMKTQKEVE